MENEETSIHEAFNLMASVCSRSEQCSPDIRKKLAGLGIEKEQAGLVINRLKEEGFIDDERYIQAYVSDKFNFNKWGRVKMRYYLKQKGFSDDLIEAGLQSIDEEAYRDLLLTVMEGKAKGIKNRTKFEKMGQVIRFAQSRGFEPELIHRYLNRVIG